MGRPFPRPVPACYNLNIDRCPEYFLHMVDLVLSPPRLYRTWLRQARLFSHRWSDNYFYVVHSYLARTAMESLRVKIPVQGSASDKHVPHIVKRRWARAVSQVQQMAWANAGWPHAVYRALEKAYGRRGRVRHELLRELLPRHPSPTATESRSVIRQRLPEISTVLRTFLLSSHSLRGSVVRSNHIDCPPKLVTAYEQAKEIGKRVARRRVANAHWRWLTVQLNKLRPPLAVQLNFPPGPVERDVRAHSNRWNEKHASLISGLEQRARNCGTTVPRRLVRDAKHKSEAGLTYLAQPYRPHSYPTPLPRFLASAAQYVERLASAQGQCFAKSLRQSNAYEPCKQFATRPRLRRRTWARLLGRSPTLEYIAKESDQRFIHAYDQGITLQQKSLLGGGGRPWHAISSGIQTVKQAMSIPQKDSKRKPVSCQVKLSPHALYSGKGPRKTTARVTQTEYEWLRGFY